MGTLTDDEKTDIRRHAGFGVFGDEATQAFGYRFMQHYGTLEYKLNHMSASEEAVVRSYLATLLDLEMAVPLASDNLDTDAAAVWTHNKREVRDRLDLFDVWRKRLCDFLGIPPGPHLGSSTNRMVV
ncbi:hypothetical protein LXA47_31355 [Massilia sp. P8910]|uniref:hypothetical protein n=1 Tax=Massilia antarctica TaxID=2765360 RepID=UPI001E5D619C|nr:hypothetical protein [Massilia antarctica]MCE3608069.1 hypothetical protein [Massilia antarctica]